MKEKKLTQAEGVELGFNHRSVERMIERGAVLIDGVVFAPIKKRPAKSKK